MKRFRLDETYKRVNNKIRWLMNYSYKGNRVSSYYMKMFHRSLKQGSVQPKLKKIIIKKQI